MDPNLGRLLLDGFRWVDAALLAGLEERLGIRLTSAQSQLFAEISLAGSRQADLARVLGVSRQAVNELVRGLEAAGMVELVPDPESARSKLVKPTALGAESVEVALAIFADIERELAARIGGDTLGNASRTCSRLGRSACGVWRRRPVGAGLICTTTIEECP